MRFRIDSTSYYEPGELVANYPNLLKHDLEVKKETIYYDVPIKDENGKTIWQQNAGNRSVEYHYVTIDSLEDLVDLLDDVRESNSWVSGLIISKNDRNICSIEIYDGYRE